MVSLELYINKQLCEIENPENFSVYLKRVLLNPSELSPKDAQRSYDITLPATAINNAIFGYTNTEEVKGKFSQLYDAQLLVGGVKIFDGKFKISEITKSMYKGNLGIPAPKTVKDIFGEKMMNQTAQWLVDFSNAAQDMTAYNTGTYNKIKYGEIPPVFFPLVLYGLLPKDPTKTGGTYTAKDEFDESVTLRLGHIPPSINCLQAIKQIFEGGDSKMKISGTAFDDERLKNLYMSYKNPKEYTMPWNYGKLAKASLSGSWTNYRRGIVERNKTFKENPPYLIDATYTVDLLNASNLNISHKEGEEEILKENIYNNDEGYKINQYTIQIPYSGFYKIVFDAQVHLYEEWEKVYRFGAERVISSISKQRVEDFQINRVEVKVMRYEGESLDTNSFGYDNTFYRDNQDQDLTTTIRKFPQPGGVNFVDPSQNPNLLCGIAFGKEDGRGWDRWNPLDTGIYCNPIAIKNGPTWNTNLTDCPVRNSAVHNPKGYLEYRKLENGEFQTDRIDENKIVINNISVSNEAYSFKKDWSKYPYLDGKGAVCQVVWLDKDEKISVGAFSKVGALKDKDGKETFGWVRQDIDFNLSIEAFRLEKEWVTVDKDNNGTAVMNWNDDKTFLTDQVDLSGFLPSDQKINDWLENFCKTFNLSLEHVRENSFELNVREVRRQATQIINVDNKLAADAERTNNSLALPSVYELGFKVDKEEHGYVQSLTDKNDKDSGDDGGGRFETQSLENKVLKESSNFSYNWLIPIKNKSTNKEMLLPVISTHEPWKGPLGDYDEMLKNNYMNLLQRFWYKLSDTVSTKLNKTVDFSAGLVSNQIGGAKPMQLNYKVGCNSILDNYFTLLTDADNSYTTIECYLLPEEYDNIADKLVQYNGDLYYIAEVDGYDPLCRKKTTLKLIRKML